MGVTEGGIHWLDGLIYVGLILGVYAIYRLCVAWMEHREIQRIIEQDSFFNWEEDEEW